jgi:hypothetical protein
MKQNLNLNPNPNLDTEKQIEKQILEILRQYLNDEIDISRAATKIVDTLYPWETYYLPLMASNIDPWQARARDVLTIEDMLATCGEVYGEEESFTKCVVDYLNPDPD